MKCQITKNQESAVVFAEGGNGKGQRTAYWAENKNAYRAECLPGERKAIISDANGLWWNATKTVRNKLGLLDKGYFNEGYFDGEKTVEFEGKLAASEAGWVGKPEYRVAYKLSSGGYLSGTKHMDRGNLMTNIKTTKRLPSWATKKYQKGDHDAIHRTTRTNAERS